MLHRQLLRYFRNFFFYFHNFKLVKYFSYICQNFSNDNLTNYKQMCFTIVHEAEYEPSTEEEGGLQECDTQELAVQKHYYFCTRSFDFFIQINKTLLGYFNNNFSIIFNAFIFQGKHNNHAFLTKFQNIFKFNIKFTHQVSTYMTSWLLYKVNAYKCPAVPGSDIKERLVETFTEAVKALVPADPDDSQAKLYSFSLMSALENGHYYDPNNMPIYSLDIFDFTESYMQLTQSATLLHTVEVYRLLTILYYYKLHAITG